MNTKVRIVIMLFFIIWFLSKISSISCCRESERAALISFKSQLADPSNLLSTWRGRNCCTWHGIHCSNTLHVVAVDLANPKPNSFIVNMNSELVLTSKSSSALTGTISSSLFSLSHITYLDLSFNDFKFSKIPIGIANFTQLTYLNLSNSMFHDSITNWFSNLTSLRWLDLSSSTLVNDYSSMSYRLSSQITLQDGPESTYISNGYLSSSNLNWLNGMHNLEELHLTGVDLSEASMSAQWADPLSGLFNLRFFTLSNCQIPGEVPVDQLLNLTHLSVLEMGFNSFMSHIPARVANLTSLLTLDFTNSNLQGSIPYIPQLVDLSVGENNLRIDLEAMFAVSWPRLETLNMGSTKVIGPIPPSFANATSSLVSFIAYNSFIEGHIPSSITNLSRLETLVLDVNRLVGQIPLSISNLKSLQLLSLMQNSLDGSIPNSVCDVSSLRYLFLAVNNFSGEIPDCITNFQNLEVLYLSQNSFTGRIQSLASLFKSLNPYIIGLGYNMLTVELEQQRFPPSFQPDYLDLNSCNLGGGIPDFLSNLTQLKYLALSKNKLSGVIPSWLFNLPKLSFLDLSLNSLQGFLPPEIQFSPFFGPTILNLASNLLEGTIPSLLENIDVINLSGNNFTGYIPPQLGLGSPIYLSLSGNRLSGHIPLSFCQENKALELLDLSKNILSGAIPANLGSCTSLRVLSVAENNLGSTVPAVLENAKNLSYLDLTGNRFEGLFPSFIGKLQDLMVLKMGYNNFVGKIPRFIGDLRNLRILLLKYNLFNESIPEEINKLEKLQILDLSNNKLLGTIPEKLDGLKTLISRPMDNKLLGFVISAMYSGVELSMAYKGFTYQYDVVRTFHSGIDLSLNALTGNIPKEMTLLKGLAMLNLSHNAIAGEVPGNLGDMVGLQSLDLSFNNLIGPIPSSINLLDSLGVMNLSDNNLSGRIPPGIRFDTLYDNGWTYIGNKYLCGAPDAIINCNSDNNSSLEETGSSEDDAKQRLLFIGVVTIGYVVGFWGYFGVVNLKEQWRERYWTAIDKIILRIINSICRK